MALVKCFINPIDGSFFLLGPRGTGKTLWLLESFPDALWVNLLLPESFRFYTARPERLAEEIKARRSAEPRIRATSQPAEKFVARARNR